MKLVDHGSVAIKRSNQLLKFVLSVMPKIGQYFSFLIISSFLIAGFTDSFNLIYVVRNRIEKLYVIVFAIFIMMLFFVI